MVAQFEKVQLSGSQLSVLQKYLLPGEACWEDVCDRVARFVASAEKTEALQREWHEKFMSILVPMQFVPAGSILANAGHGTKGMNNCFVLSAEDNIQDIMKLVYDSVLTTKFRGGIGINIGSQGQPGYIRPKGSDFKDGKALGPCAVLDMVSESAAKITTGNKARRGAFMFSMDWRHPDIWEFIQAKTQSVIDASVLKKAIAGELSQEEFEKAWVETHLSPEGKRQRRWHNANISVQVDDEFFDLLEEAEDINKRLGEDWKNTTQEISGFSFEKIGLLAHVKKLWDAIAQFAHATADPGLILISNMKRSSPIKDFLLTTNPCLTGDTLVLTREGHYPIKSLVGKTTEIWDGTEWRAIDNFRVTGENQKVYRVTLHNGQSVEATAYHKFILADGTRKQLKELEPGDRLLTHNLQIHGDIHVEGAYLKGFLVGDGCFHQEKSAPQLWLYPPKFGCEERLVESGTQVTTGVIRTNCIEELGFSPIGDRRRMTGLTARKTDLTKWTSDFKKQLPHDALNWDYISKCEFIAGVMDADGTASDTSGGFMYQICSIHKQWLEDFQVLLRTIGVKSKLALMKKRQMKDFGDRGGVCQTQDCYRLTISQASSIILAQQVRFSRLKSFADKKPAYSSKSRESIVSSIEFSHVADKVYCCTVEGSHSFSLSNGLVIGQCGEVPLPKDSSCNLGSVNLSKFIKNGAIDWGGLRQATYISVRFLDNVLDVSEYATPEQKHAIQNQFRQLGLGIMGWADLLKSLRIPYDSEEDLALIAKTGSFIARCAYRTSEALAIEKGACGIWEQIKNVVTGNPFEYWYDPLSGDYGRRYIRGDEVPDNSSFCQVPRRNATVLSIAPTGSIAQLAGCSWAFEPDFGLSIWKQVFVDASTSQQQWIQILNPYLEELNLSESDRAIVLQSGSLQGTEFAANNPEAAAVFKVAGEITPEWHIKVQAAWQKWIDSSISKTINLPKAATIEDIKQAYRLAQKSGLKGVTVYRDGTLESEPIKVGDRNNNDQDKPEEPKSGCRSGLCDI